MIATGNAPGLRELLTRYDGVVGNPELRQIETADGFAATRGLLRQYVGEPIELTEPIIDATNLDESSTESIPLPEPIPAPESLPIDHLEI